MSTNNENKRKGKVIPFLPSHSYSAYQCHFTITKNDETSDNCFNYLFLLIQKWLDEKMGKETHLSPADYKEIKEDDFKPINHEDDMYQIHTIYDKYQNAWALNLREPDSDTGDGVVIPGRFFITQVGIIIVDKKQIEFGCKIDVIDPEGASEIDYAYRPRFIRDFFTDETLNITHEGYGLTINGLAFSKDDQKVLMNLLSSKANQMPITVITDPCIKLDNNEEKINKFLKENPISMSHTKVETLTKELDTLEKKKGYIEKAIEEAGHDFGYSNSIFIPADSFKLWKKITGINEDEGYACIIYPKKFGGGKKIYKNSEVEKDNFMEKIKKDARSYSKHKNYDYGIVKFYKELYNEYNQKRVETLISEKEQLNKNDLSELIKINRELEEENIELKKEISNLEYEKNNEYERAKNKFEFSETLYTDDIEKLEEENEQLKRKLNACERKLERLTKVDRKGGDITLESSGLENWYEDEERDLIINMLQYAKPQYCEDKSRSEELIDKILENNQLTGKGIDLFEEIKTVFNGNEKMNESVKQELIDKGFTVKESKNADGHHNIKFKDRKRYTFEIASTPGDKIRGMKYSFSKIQRKLSIYKNPNMDYKGKKDN